jgi:RNA polymerase sigma factor (sigma-70 family)
VTVGADPVRVRERLGRLALPLPDVPVRSSDAAAERVGELFASLERRIGRYLAQMVGDRSLAEDLLQDTFHDALKARDQLDEVRSPEAWLYGIARHRALAALRRRRRFHRALARLERGFGWSLEEEPDVLGVRELLERSVRPDERALLVLRYLHGFDAPELAEMTGRTPDAVRQQLSRARRKLLAAAGAEGLLFRLEEEARP